MSLSVGLFVVLSGLTILLAIFHYTTDRRKYWLKRNILYREPCPIFGNFGATLTLRQSYTQTLHHFYDKYRNERFVGLFMARRPTLMVKDLELIKEIFSTRFQNFSDRISVATDTQREPLLRNLANMRGAEWTAMRHAVSPTFTSAKLKAMFPLVVDCTHGLKETFAREHDEVEVPKVMTRYTTDVIGSCAFGFNPGSLQSLESPFFKMSQKMFKTTRSASLRRYCRAFFPRIFRLLNLRSYTPDVEAFFTNIMRQVLEERRKPGAEERHDFIQLMLNEQKTETGSPMTDELITSNSFIFMLAGLETSSTTSSFCLYELAKNKELQDKLRVEIKECIGRHGGLCYEAVAEMHLVRQSILETLRKHPPTPMTTRVCTQPCTLPGTDLRIEVGQTIIIPFHSIQNDPQYFPNPDKFDPERFKDDSSPPGFMTFGDGPRMCPGARFANLVVAAGLAAILSTLSVEPCARTTPRINYDTRSVMLKNKGSIWLKFTPL